MSQRLYYDDAYLTGFRARVVDRQAGERKIALDQTAFYPSSGGQPHDLGSINGVPVLDVMEDDAGIVWHHTAASIDSPEVVECTVDWPRRFDHMQQHSGQHLLSAVLAELYEIQTVSFHMGPEVSTIDLSINALPQERLEAAERRCAEVVFENRPLSIVYEDAASAQGLRKASERSGPLRIVSIRDLDRSACGGTHVRATGEIGPVLLRKTEKVRNTVRLEFVCGFRAILRARQDYDLLSKVARVFSTAMADAPAAAAAQQEQLARLEKTVVRVEAEVARARGERLHSEIPPNQRGTRFHERKIASGGSLEELRAEASGFTTRGAAVFLAWSEEPTSVLLAASPDSGLNAGALLKAAVQEAGGRGGGSSTIAQGSVPGRDGLEVVLARIRDAAGA